MACALASTALFAVARQEKVIQIFKGGEVIKTYGMDEIDYIEVNDLVPAPDNIGADVADNTITISWNAVEGATYDIYRSPDNVNFTLLASGLTENHYTDNAPLRGSNFYRVKALVDGNESGYTASVGATTGNEEKESGIYLGVIGFNQDLYSYPMLQLTEESASGFTGFIDGLTMKNGTLLYYSVDQALTQLQTADLPSDLSTAAIVTFTDGLDQGSMMKDVNYATDSEYLDAMNHRINNETVAGTPITAYSIGIRGKDVADIEMFRTNLTKLASQPENAMEVSSMSEVNKKFKEIAERLSQSNYVQTINLTIPGVSNGTKIRFTFDNVAKAENSQLYIEGTFNLKERSLNDVKYVGLSSTSGSTIQGTVDGIFVNFRFEGVHADNNVVIKGEFTDEWTYIAQNATWQVNSEFDKTQNTDIVTKRSSAAIMLVLDCSSSLADDFVNAQNNAKDFINTLCGTTGNSGNTGGETTIYSTTPVNLGVAIWKEGTRYYLTRDQAKSANLTGVYVEGLCVVSAMGSFIISPGNMSSTKIIGKYGMQYYSDILPDKDQATVISARYLDINSALGDLGWFGYDSNQYDYYLTKTSYNANTYYAIYLYNHTGGSLTTASSGYVKGVKSVDAPGPIVWRPAEDLALLLRRDNEIYYTFNADLDLSGYEILGVGVFMNGECFAVKLHDEQTGKVNYETALSLYGDVLPNEAQARIISMRYYDINHALQQYGGNQFASYQYDYYLTKAPNSSNTCMALYLFNHTGGELSYNSNGYVRGLITLNDYFNVGTSDQKTAAMQIRELK